MLPRETTHSSDTVKEGDRQSPQTVNRKRKLELTLVPEAQEEPYTAAHQIAKEGLPGVFGVPEPPAKKLKTEHSPLDKTSLDKVTNTTERNQSSKDNIIDPSQDTIETLQHGDLPEGSDLISEDEIKTAKDGFERFKVLVEKAPKDIKPYFLEGSTGSRLQAMHLGTKPVIFNLTSEIQRDAWFITSASDPSSENITDEEIASHQTPGVGDHSQMAHYLSNEPPIYDTHKGLSEDDFLRKFLAEVVQPTYNRIRDHIIETDTLGDIRFIDLATRDYLDKDDPHIHDEGEVTIAQGDHAIYSNRSVKKLFTNHPDVFPSDHSDNLIRSFISKHTPIIVDDLVYGLLCGYPRHAVEVYSNDTGLRTHEEGYVDIFLNGYEYRNKGIDESDRIIQKKDQALYHLSGMKDFINTF